MANYSLYLSVNGGQIFSAETLLAADSVEYITAVFAFDDSWDDLYKTATFRTGELVYSVPLEEDCCEIPYEALRDGMLYISVYGVSGTTRATATEFPIQVEKSGYVPSVPSAPTSDPYSYFLEKVTELKQQAEQAAESSYSSSMAANAANADTQQSRTLAQQARDDSQQVLIEVQNAAAAAEQQSGLAEVAKNAAETSATTAVTAADLAQSKAEDAKQYAAAAADSAENAQQTVMNELEVHNAVSNAGAHPNLVQLASEAKAIALGKASALIFADQAELIAWLAGSFTRPDGKTPADLKIGDNLYLIETGTPDYWWDGSEIQPLDADRPDLSDYYTKAQIDTRFADLSFTQISRSAYDALFTAGGLAAGTIYFVYEEE